MSRESPFLGLSSVLNKISKKTLPFSSRPSQTSKNIGVLRALSIFELKIVREQSLSLTGTGAEGNQQGNEIF